MTIYQKIDIEVTHTTLFNILIMIIIMNEVPVGKKNYNNNNNNNKLPLL